MFSVSFASIVTPKQEQNTALFDGAGPLSGCIDYASCVFGYFCDRFTTAIKDHHDKAMVQVAKAFEIFFQVENVLVWVVQGGLSDIQLEPMARIVDEDASVLALLFGLDRPCLGLVVRLPKVAVPSVFDHIHLPVGIGGAQFRYQV